MPKVNPQILSWARETTGLTPEEAVGKLQLKAARGVSAVERLAALEVGEDQPSRPMLVKMAKQYRRPILTFYLSAPPRRGDRGQDFRTLPEGQAAADEALLDALIRDVQARQSMVRAVLEDEDESDPIPFIGTKKLSDGVPSVLAAIRETLPMKLSEYRAQPTATKAFGLLREAAEEMGVFVLLRGNLGSHYSAIGLDTFRGFALADPVAPFVVINEYDARAAWSFTLIHELAHLWLGETGVSGSGSELAIERFCNDVASEFLLPSKELRRFSVPEGIGFEDLAREIDEFASERNLSGSMIAYKLYRIGAIDKNTWRDLSRTFRRRWIEQRDKEREKQRALPHEEKSGPNTNVVRGHRVGNALLSLVDRMMGSGVLTTSKAGIVLGVRGKQVQALLDASGHGGVHRLA